jgi:hypothetical protein
MAGDMGRSETSGAEPDPPITVTLPRSEWEALLSVEPLAKETYTEPGLAIFNAFQAIHHAVDPDGEAT